MVVLSRGRELIKGFAKMDAESLFSSDCSGNVNDTLSCCLEPPLMHTNFLRDMPFKQMRKCIPLEIGTE